MSNIKNFINKYWLTIAIFFGLFLIYYYVSSNNLINPFLFPEVSSIARNFEGETLIKNLLSSLSLLLPSLFLGTVIALLLGIAVGLNEKLRTWLSPIINAISVIPAVILTPFALQLLPNFTITAVFVMVYNIIWPTYFATVNGILTIEQNYLDIADTLEIKGFKRIWKVLLPAASPSILSGFITSLRSSFLVLVVAEMYGFENGLGYYIQNAAILGMFNKVWAGFVWLVIVLVFVVFFFDKVKDYLLRWTIDQK